MTWPKSSSTFAAELRWNRETAPDPFSPILSNSPEVGKTHSPICWASCLGLYHSGLHYHDHLIIDNRPFEKFAGTMIRDWTLVVGIQFFMSSW